MDVQPCVQLDGCCHTHSPCFDAIAEALEAQLEGAEVPKLCQGWPCPVSGDS